MKKILFALLAVMIIGTMAACNGEVDYLLWNDDVKGTPSKTITLVLDVDYLSFEKGMTKVDQKVCETPYETWQALYDSNFTLTVYGRDSAENGYEEEFTMSLKIAEYWGNQYMEFLIGVPNYSIRSDVDPIRPSSSIEDGTAYLIESLMH